MDKEPFFSRDGDGYIVNKISAGPWNPDALHGRVVIGLLAYAIEQCCGDDAYMPARLTVDMYRLPGLDPITVSTRLRAGREVAGTPGVDPAKTYARLAVSDSAGGIADAVLDRIFEPFFTTKGRHRGTGLGLAVVHGVVESHDAVCRVTSRPGGGTTFAIYLPLVAAPDAEQPRGEPAAVQC